MQNQNILSEETLQLTLSSNVQRQQTVSRTQDELKLCENWNDLQKKINANLC